MYQEKPIVMYARNYDGRHWLTTLAFPPLQIAPVAANHCRVAYFLATVISSKLLHCGDKVPEVLRLTRADVRNAQIAAGPDANGDEAGEVFIRLVFESAASSRLSSLQCDERFLTPRPTDDWQGSYDQWIFTIARQLGMSDAPAPADQASYKSALALAIDLVRQKIPDLRELYIQGLSEWRLRFKVGLLNNFHDLEYVWVQPLDWSDIDNVVCMIESEPHNCDGYWSGQVLRVPVSNLVDYSLSDKSEQVVESGVTQQIAEDYGITIIHH